MDATSHTTGNGKEICEGGSDAGTFRRLLENLPGIAYSLYIREGRRMVFFNDMLGAMTGYTPEELGQGEVYPMDTIMIGEDRDGALLEIRRAIDGDLPFEINYRIRHKDATVRHFLERGRPVRGGDGKPLLVDGFIFDITGGMATKEMLQEAEQKYRHLFDNLNDAAFLADIGTGVIVETNKQGEALLGRNRDEIVGMHQREVHPPGKSEEYARKFSTHIEKGRLADYEGEVARKDGAVVQVHISAAPVNIGDKKLILGLFRDITDRKKVELERERLITELKEASGRIKTLKGMLPICASCKKIRDDKGYWQQVEEYIRERSEAEFTHGLCPICASDILKDVRGKLK